jgi:ferredoxin
MRVVVDQLLCEGHLRCEAAAPSVFAVGDDDLSRVLVDDIGDDLRPGVDEAIRICPRQAIHWAEHGRDTEATTGTSS